MFLQIIQAVYFTICVLNDIFGSSEVAPKKVPAIRKLKDYIMAAFAFPLALNVGISFWTLWHIDRELVLPRVLDSILPRQVSTLYILNLTVSNVPISIGAVHICRHAFSFHFFNSSPLVTLRPVIASPLSIKHHKNLTPPLF